VEVHDRDIDKIWWRGFDRCRGNDENIWRIKDGHTYIHSFDERNDLRRGIREGIENEVVEMYDVDIFKEDRKKLLEQFEKEKQAMLEKGKIEGKAEGKTEGKIEALRENV